MSLEDLYDLRVDVERINDPNDLYDFVKEYNIENLKSVTSEAYSEFYEEGGDGESTLDIIIDIQDDIEELIYQKS